MKKLLAIGLVLLMALSLGACGGSDSTGASTDPQDTTAAAETPPEMADSGDWAALKNVAGRYSDRLLIPEGEAPEEVVVRDLKVGKGPVIQKGDTFEARYVSFGYENGLVSEPYWRSPSFYTFGLGKQREAWEVGLEGIREGGIRELISPSAMAYENGALVYVVQVIKLP